MSEYILVVLLVAIGTIGVVGVFGANIRSLFAANSNALAGEDQVSNDGYKQVSRGLKEKKLRTAGNNALGGVLGH